MVFTLVDLSYIVPLITIYAISLLFSCGKKKVTTNAKTPIDQPTSILVNATENPKTVELIEEIMIEPKKMPMKDKEKQIKEQGLTQPKYDDPTWGDVPSEWETENSVAPKNKAKSQMVDDKVSNQKPR
ncbi:hypothetical protein DdX_02974 [Ditylenchus destructor]|uniref:Uncharacterized protein n=1 Tax=Ditylenchus destructor TaxID=166010 RepID=A0AAD4NC70_9BILA|nr:hypothetical protein DdX_02974 [Ditylenchus destructor]